MQIVAGNQYDFKALVISVLFVAVDFEVVIVVNTKHSSLFVVPNQSKLVFYAFQRLHEIVEVIISAFVEWNHFLELCVVPLAVNSDDILDISGIGLHLCIEVAFYAKCQFEANLIQIELCILVVKVGLICLRDERVLSAHHLIEFEHCVSRPN